MAQNSSHLFMFVFLFLLRCTRSTPTDLCRLMEFEVKIKDFPLDFNDIEQRLFYRTDHFCQKKPVLRSLFYPNLYQFQAPNNRWWTLYQSNDTRQTQIGSKQWCQAWNMKPVLTLPLGIFQQAWTKAKHLQKWRRVQVHTKNQSFSYQSVSNVHLKCYSSSSKTSCSTKKIAFLFDLTSSTNTDEFEQMKLWSKTLIWLLLNQTSIGLSCYRDRFHLIQSFDHRNQSSNEHIEHLFDSIDTINRYPSDDRRIAVPWADAISHVLTRLFKRRFLLPIVVPKNITDSNLHSTNESSEEDIYTEPYPLFVNDDEAIKTVLNISNLPPERKKRSINSSYNPAENVLVILTARSKTLFDYTRKDEKLSRLISDVPLRIVVIDFHANSNQRTAESHHSAFFDKAKYALASVPVRYNSIQTWLEIGDALHGYQLWDHHHRLCHPPIDDTRHWNSTLVERTSRTMDSRSCSIIRLFETTSDKYLTLKDQLEFTFYRSIDQCFSAPVFRSLTDRNLYIQRIPNGKWIVIRVDPLLPSTSVQQRQRSSTTTSTLPPEFFEEMDSDEESLLVEPNDRTISIDLPTSVPHCSDQPGLELLFESDGYYSISDPSFPMTSGWISHVNQSEIISPICNKYQISCRKTKFDLLVVVDCYREDGRWIENLLQTFLNLIEPNEHRFSLVILTSTNVDPFQYHLPLTSIETLDVNSIDRYFIYLDDHNESVVPLVNHLQRLSDYLITQRSSAAQSIVLTISSRLNVDRSSMSNLIERYSSIRYMAIDAQLKTDDEQYDPDRFRLFRSFVSQPVNENLLSSFAAHRDLTFNQVFQLIERLCGDLINFEQHDEHH